MFMILLNASDYKGKLITLGNYQLNKASFAGQFITEPEEGTHLLQMTANLTRNGN